MHGGPDLVIFMMQKPWAFSHWQA